MNELGTEVYVTLQARFAHVCRMVLALLVPEVILGEATAQSFQTLAILTKKEAEVVRPGTALSYTVLPLPRTARLVLF